MENCLNKHDLVEYYSQYYPDEYYKPWLNLALTKLASFTHWKKGKINDEQVNKVNELLVKSDFSKEDFITGLNLFSYQQISYVGW